jgi:TP901 family phage tail tape measure protein
MPELGTAWINVTVKTGGMEDNIKRALRNVEKAAKLSPDVDTSKTSAKATQAGSRYGQLFSRSAKAAPDVDTSRLSGQASSAGSRFGQLFSRSAKAAPDVDTSRLSAKATAAGQDFGNRFSAGAKAGLAALGAAGLASTVIDQFRQVVTVGMDYTKNMNTLQAVTKASADEMRAAGDAARQLGVDASLPATSVNDAASAMTELAKSGLSVQDAMAAAKGTLQLASAAGVSAQQAAVIQGDALNTFQLGADQANRVADLLAGAANASSGEITDFAMGLAQAGSVAAGFKVPIEDTITSLAMFAKFGVKGSDAGTMMKTSLQAITDQSKPAQAAMKELGLELYKNGTFVGYPEMLKQVAAASERMTDEQFQAATAVLFGSDAMRSQMIAANGGAEAFDGLAKQVTALGNAGDVSQAKTKGLPGAWERVKNTLESLQLQVYDLVDGPLTTLLDFVTKGMEGLGKVGETSAFRSIADAVKSAAPGIADIAISLGKAAGAIGAAAWQALTTALSGVAEVLKILSPLLKAVGSFMRDNQGLVTAFVGAFAGFKLLPGVLSKVSGAFLPLSTAIGNIGPKARAMGGGLSSATDSWRTMVTYMQQADPALTRAEARMAAVKTSAGQSLGALKGAAGGLVGVLGGPLNIALMAGATALGVIATENARAAQAADGYRDAVKASADAQVSLNDALLASNGLLTENAKLEASKRIQATTGEIDAGSKSTASFLDRFRDENGSLLNGLTDWSQTSLAEAKGAEAKAYSDAAAAIDNLKLSQEALDAQVTGSQSSFDALAGALEKQGAGGQLAAEKLRETRAEILGAQEAAATAAPVLARLGDNVEQSAANVRTAFAALPTDVPITVSAPGGQQVYELLKQLGVEVTTNNEKEIVTTAPLAPEVLQMLEALGIKVTENNDKTITVTQTGAEVAGDAIDAIANKEYTAVIKVLADTQAAAIDAGAAIGVAPRANGAIVPRADGAIVPMAAGGLRMIEKPDQADIYDGVGAGTIFAEEETGGEAYIPLAPAKRQRSTAILAEVARLFGLSLSAPSGAAGASVSADGPVGGNIITSLSTAVTAPIVSALEQIRDAIASSGSARYTSGSPLSVSMSGGDAALLSRVPSGSYSQTQAADLTKGLGDCSSAVEDLVNMMDGMPTAGRDMFTGNAAKWLTSRGFLPTDTPMPGTFQVGFNNTHMEATLPEGTAFNWGGDASAASGGVAGATGAWAEGFTQQFYRPAGATGASWQTLAKTSDELNTAMGERTTAEQKLTEVTNSQITSAQASVTAAQGRVTSAQARLDQAEATIAELTANGADASKLSVAATKRDAAMQALDAAQGKQVAAEQKLAEVTEKQAAGVIEDTKTAKDTSGNDASSLGQSLFSGVLESIGLDGSVFSNPLEWANVKSGMALANWGGGLLQGLMGGSGTDGAPGADLAGGNLALPGLPNIADFIKPLPDGTMTPQPDAPHQGGGQAPGPAGPSVVVNGDLGVNPRDFTQRIDAKQNQALRRNIAPVRPS